MKKVETLIKIKQSGVIAVVRGETAQEALQSSRALIKGGITGIEVTYTIPNASEVIETLSTEYPFHVSKVVIGAGTVLDVGTARLAILSGAQYIVSPSFDLETAKLCNLYQVPYLPGCQTITEMQQALKSGADIIKLFPASLYGPKAISAFKAPLPQLNIMPTGGVSLDNMEAWFEAGVVAVGVGGSLLAPAKNGDYEKITKMAREYAEKLEEIKRG